MKELIFVLAAASACALAVMACSPGGGTECETPIITCPTNTFHAGDALEVESPDHVLSGKDTKVLFDGSQVPVDLGDDTSIRITVPAGTAPGDYELKVYNSSDCFTACSVKVQ